MSAAGDRVRLIHTSDEYTRLAPGTEGTVSLVDSVGTVHVRWDDGSRLGLVPGVDRWESAPDVPTCRRGTFGCPVEHVDPTSDCETL